MATKTAIEERIAIDYDQCMAGAKSAFEFCKEQPVVTPPPQPWYWAWWPAPATCAEKYSSRKSGCMETMISRQERLLRAQAPITKISQVNNQNKESPYSDRRDYR